MVEANETPAVFIVRWPNKPTVLHPYRFPTAADAAARTFAAAAAPLAAIKRCRRFRMEESHAGLVPMPAPIYRMTEQAQGKEHKPDDHDEETNRR